MPYRADWLERELVSGIDRDGYSGRLLRSSMDYALREGGISSREGLAHLRSVLREADAAFSAAYREARGNGSTAPDPETLN